MTKTATRTEVVSAACAAEQQDTAIIELDRIHVGSNVRASLPDIDELAASIAQWGVLTAIVVTRRSDGDYDLDAGARRLAASRVAGRTTIPAVIREALTPLDRLERLRAENGNRVDLTDLDNAHTMQQMLDLGASVKDVAKRFNTTPDNVDGWRAVLSLPESLVELIRSGDLRVEDAATLRDGAQDEELLAEIIANIEAGYAPRTAVTTAVRTRERAAQLAKAQAKLEKEGCPVVEAPQWESFSPNGKMQRLGDGVKVALREHRKMPCHGAFIDRNGRAVYVCADRKVHAGVAGSGVPDLKAERAAKRAESQALKNSHTLRSAAIEAAITGDAEVDGELVNRHLLHLSIQAADPRIRDGLCERLGLTGETRAWRNDSADRLVAYIGGDDARLQRVALALALLNGERSMTSERGHYDYGYPVAAHLAFLSTAGLHVATDVEQRRAAERGAVRVTLPEVLGGSGLAEAAEAEAEEEMDTEFEE